MDWLTVLNTVGIAGIAAALIYIGRKLQILDDLQKTSEKIKQNLKYIGDHLTQTDTKFDPSELQAFSPLQLTEAGKQLISSMKFDKIYEHNSQDFVTFIDNQSPKLKYDVELAAIQSITVLADKEYMNFLKIFFYNNPDRNMQNVSPTLGVYVRDKYLANHPEITE